MKSRNVAIFIKKKGLPQDDTNLNLSEDELSNIKNEKEKEDLPNDTNGNEYDALGDGIQDQMQPEEKRIQYFSFININDITPEQQQNIKFSPDSVRDVTDKFLDQLQPIGT